MRILGQLASLHCSLPHEPHEYVYKIVSTVDQRRFQSIPNQTPHAMQCFIISRINHQLRHSSQDWRKDPLLQFEDREKERREQISALGLLFKA